MKTRSYLLWMLVAVIVPVTILSVIGLSMLLQSERDARIRTIREMAHSTSLVIDGEILAAEASLRTVAYSRELREGNFAQLHALLSATRTSPLSWSLITDYEGSGQLNTLVPFGTPLAVRQGTWASKAYDAQHTHVSSYFIGTLSKRGVVSVDVPVPAVFDKKYVVTQIFDPSYFNKVFQRNTLQPNWIIGIFDAEGRSIARNKEAARLVGKPVRPELLAASRQQESGMIRNTTREGAEVYSMFARSALTGWTVAIGVPLEEIAAPASVTTRLAATAMLAMLGAAVAIAIFFGRRIDTSIRNATAAAHALARGDVPPATRSHLQEANVLLEVLHQTGIALSGERTARMTLERERERLLALETSARLRAEADSIGKDNFIAMLSHELRNPLAAITGAVTVIRLPNLPVQKSEKAWDIVRRQLNQLTRMVEDLLDVRRVLSGKVTLDRQRVNIGSVVRFCCDSRIMASPRQFIWDIQTGDAWVLGDKTRIEQIVDNLLVNAMKFSAEGTRISVHSFSAGGIVTIDVADQGIGIAAEDLPTIFDALVQAPTAIDRSRGGLGLGLSIVRGLVDMHAGTISAHSSGAHMGSVFTVRFPACDAPPVRHPDEPVAGDQAARF